MALVLLAAAAAPSYAEAPAACSGPEYHQLDFLLGVWNDRRIGPDMPGTHVEMVAGGCALLEERAGNYGKAFVNVHYYAAEDKRWHLRSVRSNGEVVELVGSLEGGELRYRENTRRSTLRQVIYTPLVQDGKRAFRVSVKVSSDGGKNFDSDDAVLVYRGPVTP